jgi:biofilm PGA synthesis N-glycosyltransferase PgaC
MFRDFLFILFIAVGLINLVHFGFYLVGANIYDIWQTMRTRNMPKRPHTTRPLVSVLIPAHNEEKAIIRCLESVRKSSYRKIEIIVIDDASTDSTAQLVMNYICQHPNRSISLLVMHKNRGKAGALNHALDRQAQGDLVMTLDADSVLQKQAISNAVSYFSDPRVAGVAANVRIMDSKRILGLLQKFEHMIGYRSKKFYSLANGEFIVGGVGSTYRRDILQEVNLYDEDTVTEDIGLSLKIVSLGNRMHRIIYAADVVAMTEGVQTFDALIKQRYRWKMGNLQNLIKNRHLFANNGKQYSRALTLYRIPMAFLGEFMLLLEPLILGYIAYLSIIFHNPSIIIGAYATITIYILWTLWPDEHTSWFRKLQLTAYAPFMYFVFYIMNIIQYAAIIRCLFNYRQVLRKGEATGNWISPERSGRPVQIS